MMDHTEATRKFAAEQYILGELSETDQEEFEQHFFACPDCAETVEAGTALVANARAVFAEREPFRSADARERKKWFFWAGWRMAPAAALAGWAVAGILAGYQYLRGPSDSGQLVLAPAALVRATRASQELIFSKQKGMMAFTVAHEWEEAYASYQGELERAADHRIVLSRRMAAGQGPEDSPLSISIRPERLQAGAYSLILYGLAEGARQRTPLERISFTLTE